MDKEEMKNLVKTKLSAARKNTIADNALFARLGTDLGMDVKDVTNNDEIFEERKKPQTVSFAQSRYVRK